jgi:NAD(P)-dependent dehydrogenase (short-subunit alcohol dehydrogenase family)
MPSILITGVSSGIGRACATLFATHGWEVTGTVRDPASPDAALASQGVRLEALDLSVAGSAAALGGRVLERYGCPDVLLNNAGIVQFGPLETYPADELERIFRINVFSQLELVRALLPSMRERGGGVIANVTSLGGTLVFPFFAGYNATKWALEGLSEGLWHELKPFGIRVKAIEPGFVETAIWGKALPGEGQEPSGPEPYLPFMRAMIAFEAGIKDRTAPAQAAEQVYDAIVDDSDRLRYPVAAYARALVGARRLLGGQNEMRLFHKRWMGPDSEGS